VEESEATQPTAEWVTEQLNRLHEVLTGATPAAGVALRNLIGKVVVSEVGQDGRKRKHLRGTFTMRTATMLGAAGVTVVTPDRDSPGETVTLDFIDPPPWARVAEAVKEKYDAGIRYEDMAELLGCPRSWPAKALEYWHRERGLPPPDGRSTRSRLSVDPTVVERSEKAKALWDEGQSMQEIALKLGCCRDTVTADIGYWHDVRGLPTPDGRSRRKELRLTSDPIDSDQASA
jgi:site-specific DNA recombinase